MVTRAEMDAKRAKSADRKARRASKLADTEKLMAQVSGLGPSLPDPGSNLSGHIEKTAARGGHPSAKPTSPQRRRNKKRKKNARQTAFMDLKAACKEFVFARNAAKNDGFCEIAVVCGGAQPANTWYHGWPQKGGNGLKYDVRSHFASCGDCNMGEYGARYRGSDVYKDRHKELLGLELWTELNALHGRRPIKTYEAREMTAEIRARRAALGVV